MPEPHSRRALETLTELVRFDTRTETRRESDLGRLLLERLSELGLEAQLVEAGEGRVNAVGVWRGEGGGTSLMFNGHVDTNPLTAGWTVDPWGGFSDGTFVYGLGVSNMKAGCASYLEAVRTLREADWRPRGDVVLEFVVGELQNGVGTRALIEAGYRADFFVNCEPTDLAALTTHAGALSFDIELRGQTRHMSKREEAADAAAAAAALLPEIDAMTFGGADEEALRTNRAHVGVLRAGLGQEMLASRPPQVADVAHLLGSARYGPGQTADSVLVDLQQTVDRVCSACPGVGGAVRRVGEGGAGSMEMPFHVARDSPIVRAVNESYRRIRGGDQPTGALRPYCFYGSDASLLQHLAGMPGVVCGPGGKYNTMPDERVEIVDYLDAISIHMHTIRMICG